MKNTYFIILIMFATLIFYSCQRCQDCQVITESNYGDAQRKCDGKANSYPNDYDEISSYTTEVCGKAPQTSIFSSDVICEGVTAVTRVRYSCN